MMWQADALPSVKGREASPPIGVYCRGSHGAFSPRDRRTNPIGHMLPLATFSPMNTMGGHSRLRRRSGRPSSARLARSRPLQTRFQTSFTRRHRSRSTSAGVSTIRSTGSSATPPGSSCYPAQTRGRRIATVDGATIQTLTKDAGNNTLTLLAVNASNESATVSFELPADLVSQVSS